MFHLDMQMNVVGPIRFICSDPMTKFEISKHLTANES